MSLMIGTASGQQLFQPFIWNGLSRILNVRVWEKENRMSGFAVREKGNDMNS